MGQCKWKPPDKKDAEGYQCPYDFLEKRQYCILHLPFQAKNTDEELRAMFEREFIRLHKAGVRDFRGVFFHHRTDTSRLPQMGGNKEPVDLAWSQFEPGLDFRRVSIRGVGLYGANLRKANLESVDLSGCNLQDAILEEANLRNCVLHNAYLKGANLKTAKNLVASQLAGADLTEAALPENVARFDSKDSLVRAAQYARKLFTPILLVCMLVVILSFRLEWTSEIKIPQIGEAVGVKYFALAFPLVLLIWFAYFLQNMKQAWEPMAKLPAFFPDGSPVTRYPDPWLLLAFARLHVKRLLDQPGAGWARLAIFLVWYLVPAALLACTVGFAISFLRSLSTSSVATWDIICVVSPIAGFLAALALARLSHKQAGKILRGLETKPFLVPAWVLLLAAAVLGLGSFAIGVLALILRWPL